MPQERREGHQSSYAVRVHAIIAGNQKIRQGYTPKIILYRSDAGDHTPVYPSPDTGSRSRIGVVGNPAVQDMVDAAIVHVEFEAQCFGRAARHAEACGGAEKKGSMRR